ncbi:MAG: tetratricopeptide repeat protein [Rubrivivax sp.]|nr:tetratricopeptide repeat protein [Rubrivivax sp.]
MPLAPADAPLLFEHFELRPAERVLRVRGEPVALGSRAFDLLLVLAQRHERLVGKQELLDLVWPGLVVEEHNIATQISTLRKLLGPGVITTLPGYGYRLTAVRRPPQAASVTAPAPAGPPAPRDNLPQPRTRFIGRESALADLGRLLPSTRLLTLTGIGGCGKTRLALQFAQRGRAAFADGVWFVDLAPLKDAGRVVSTCAAVLGLREDGDRPLMQRLVEHLATRKALLLLDNCEHVIGGVVALVDAMLSAGPHHDGGTDGTVILATSREGLGVAGEQIYPVRSLSLPATTELPDVREAESVRVFVDRARLVWPDFEVDADNAAAIVEICRRLDGIALAIELAAARVPMLTVAQIAARLDDRFRLLTGGSRALPRQQTLQTAMQWSYEQLAPPEQRLLRSMSVFAGGWTLQAAVEVAPTADEYEALALLTVLHDKSLVVVDGSDAGAAPRYRMLETVRQYAMERLHDCGEGNGARARHAAHYVAWAEGAEAHVRGPDQDAWMGRYRQEHENLIAALGWCSAGCADAQAGLRLAAATSFYWMWNGVEQGYRLTLAALAQDAAAADTPARVGALCAAAHLSLFRGHYDVSLAHAQQALAAARRIGEPLPLAQALDELGSALNTQGRTEEAVQCHEEALALARRLGDMRWMARLLNGLAESRRGAGQLDEAEAHYREALAVARQQGGRLGIVVTLNNLIRVQVAQGRPAAGRTMAQECAPLVRGQKVGVDLLEAAVGLAACLGEHERAARFWGAADQTLKVWGYRHQPVDVEHTAPWIARSRATLGEAAFEAAEAAGRALVFDAAMLELEQWLGCADR